jgi:hypothetical protein
MGPVNEQTPDAVALRGLIPELLGQYNDIVWRFDERDTCIHVRLSPRLATQRVAQVQVYPGEEVYILTFGPYSAPTFAYDSQGKKDTLRELIATAVAAVRGPSRVVSTFVGESCTRSELVLAAGTLEEHSDGVTSRNWRAALAGRLHRRRTRRETLEFARVDDPSR